MKIRHHPYVGHVHDHPEDGPIRIDSGDWQVNGRLSNFWYWTVLATGVKKHGYGGDWPDISEQYVTITIPKTMVPDD